MCVRPYDQGICSSQKIAYERRRILLTNHWYTNGIEVLLRTPLLYQEGFFLMKYRCKFVSLQITAISQQSTIEFHIKKGL